MVNDYFSLAETALLFARKPTTEWVMKQILDPDKNANGDIEGILTPSVNLTNPTVLRTIDTYEELTGWFSIRFNAIPMRDIRDNVICFESGKYFPCFHRNGKDYHPVGSLKIPLAWLHISREELEIFCDQEFTGNVIDWSKKESQAAVGMNGIARLHPESGSKHRTDALEKIILQERESYYQHTGVYLDAEKMMKRFKEIAKDEKQKVIQEVKRNVIYWKRSNGKEEQTNLVALRKRLKKYVRLQENPPAKA